MCRKKLASQFFEKALYAFTLRWNSLSSPAMSVAIKSPIMRFVSDRSAEPGESIGSSMAADMPVRNQRSPLKSVFDWRETFRIL